MRIHRVLNLAIPEVLVHKLALVAKICEGKGIDNLAVRCDGLTRRHIERHAWA